MNPDGGYTRSYRRKWDNPVFANKAQAAVWAWMIDAAQYQNYTLRTKFGPVELQPGELVISERELSDDFNLHRNTLRSLLNRMLDAGMISLIRDRIPHRVGTIVKIVKYVEYQGFNGHAYEAKDRKNDTTGTEARTEEGPKKDQEQVRQYTEEIGETVCVVDANPTRAHTREAPPPSAEIIPIRPAVWVMPDDWTLPPDWREAALSAGHWDPDGAAEKFKTTWLARRDRGEPGAANSDAVWRRYFEGWINGDLKQGPRHGQHRGGNAGRGSFISRAALGLPT